MKKFLLLRFRYISQDALNDANYKIDYILTLLENFFLDEGQLDTPSLIQAGFADPEQPDSNVDIAAAAPHKKSMDKKHGR